MISKCKRYLNFIQYSYWFSVGPTVIFRKKTKVANLFLVVAESNIFISRLSDEDSMKKTCSNWQNSETRYVNENVEMKYLFATKFSKMTRVIWDAHPTTFPIEVRYVIPPLYCLRESFVIPCEWRSPGNAGWGALTF